MKKNIIATLIFVLISAFAIADGVPGQMNMSPTNDETSNFLLPDGYFNINYNLGWGIGDMNDFISDISYRGFNIDGRKFLNDNFTLGGYMGWTGFQQKYDRATYEYDAGTLTGVVTTTYYNFTLGMNAHYYPMPGAMVQPYVGLGMGPVYQTLQRQIARYYTEDQGWQFMIIPEIGVYVPFGPDSEAGVNTGIRYNLVSYQNSHYGFEGGLQYFQWFIGIAFEY